MFGLSIRLCLAITLVVCLSVTTDAKPNTDHASSIVPEEELSLVGGAENIWDDCDTSVSCQASIKESVAEELKPLETETSSHMYPTAEQMDSISGVATNIGLLTNFISAAKDSNSNPSAFYGQGLQLISEVAAIVPLEPFSGFMSLVAGIGAAFFLSDKAPKPPPVSLGDIQTAVKTALAKFQITTEINTDIPTMMAAVGTRYDDLRSFVPNTGMCCLVNSATCPAESDKCTTADSCTSKDNNPNSKSSGTAAKVNTEACCKFYEGMCEWTRPQGPTSPVDDGNAKQLFDNLIDGTKDICGTGSGSAFTVLDRLAESTFGPGSSSTLEHLKNSPQFSAGNDVGLNGPWRQYCNIPEDSCVYPFPPLDPFPPNGLPFQCTLKNDVSCFSVTQCYASTPTTQCGFSEANAVPKQWETIKQAAHAWLLGYYTLLQYGSAVFKTISINANNQAFLKEYSGVSESTQGADIFNIYHENFVTDCAMKDKAKLARSLHKLLTYMGPGPMLGASDPVFDNCRTVPIAQSTNYNRVAMCASQECRDAFFGVVLQ